MIAINFSYDWGLIMKLTKFSFLLSVSFILGACASLEGTQGPSEDNKIQDQGVTAGMFASFLAAAMDALTRPKGSL